MMEFRRVLEDCNLQDLGFVGDRYTWSNKCESANTVRAHLDRCCTSEGWSQLFPSARVKHLDMIGSDHCPILLDTEAELPRQRQRHKPIRFEALWLRSDQCEKMVKRAWGLGFLRGNENLMDRFYSCRISLMTWGKNTFGNINKRIRSLKTKWFSYRKVFSRVRFFQKSVNVRMRLKNCSMPRK
ncbi:hypothetical protein Salat_1874000 [Sesamum alatum]|uniref:Uncharacterized protein n=1 Tax=Sesamum alatum TaxID=300844 RepID=A0AAE2CI68_9LAMI|nr:hypothetical protein Salat_1874000 [Sesamum alatum]